MQSFSLISTPGAGQADGIGFKQLLVMDLGPATAGGIMPGDMVVVVGYGGSPNRGEIGVKFPWDPIAQWPTYAGGTDANGNLSFGPVACDGTGGPCNPSGLILSVGVLPGGGINPLGYEACSYQTPAPVVPAVPGLATFIAAVENSWNTHIPVVDYLAASTWQTGSYETITPFSILAQIVTFGAPLAISQSAAEAMATLLGGTVVSILPDKAHYLAYYADPGAIAGTLTPVLVIQAEMPVGPNGSTVMAEAYGGDIASAIFMGRVSGIQAAVLACFTPLAA